MYTCIKLFFESIFMICHAWTLDVTQESNKPVLGRLTANICIPSEKGPLASEILGVFELDLVARLRSEGSQVYWKSNVLIYGISNRIRHCVSLRTCQLKYLIVNEFSQTLTKCYTHKSCFDIINSFNLIRVYLNFKTHQQFENNNILFYISQSVCVHSKPLLNLITCYLHLNIRSLF